MFTAQQRKLLFISSLGGVLEFYDFIIYALLASFIAEQFFPTGNSSTSLIATFATFSVGYLMRPIGGIFFGHFGDKYGRKTTFTFSILMMAIATICIGFVPSYAAIGIAAPIILTFLRILQGLSVGGEIPGAIAYVSESIIDKKGLACGVIFFSLINGIVLGALLLAIFTTLFSEQQMLSWGWRLPFIFGGIFGFISYLLRLNLQESNSFQTIADKVEKVPMIAVFRKKPVNAIAGIFIVGLCAASISLLFLFIPAYLQTVLHIKSIAFAWYKTAALFLTAIFAIIFGALADKYSPKKLIFILSILAAICAYPIFCIYDNYFSYYIIALFLSALITGFSAGVIPPLLADLFPTEIRYSGVAFSYNIGFAMLGGLTPLIASILIYQFHSSLAPAVFLIMAALLSIISLVFAKQYGKNYMH